MGSVCRMMALTPDRAEETPMQYGFTLPVRTSSSDHQDSATLRRRHLCIVLDRWGRIVEVVKQLLPLFELGRAAWTFADGRARCASTTAPPTKSASGPTVLPFHNDYTVDFKMAYNHYFNQKKA